MNSILSAIGDVLFTKTQQQVLGLLYSKPEQSYYLNEIVRLAAMGKGTVKRELEKLSGAGLLTITQRGNQSHYQANPNNPIFAELKSITLKTFGVADCLKSALEPLTPQIQQAFIFGSVASGSAGSHSDLDLCVVGDVAFGALVKALYDSQQILGREINPKCFTLKEWQDAKKEHSGFIQELLEKPVINVIGDRDDLNQSSRT